MRARDKAALALAGALIAAAPAAAEAAAPRPADTVFRNGYVRTVDARDSVRQALAVRRGKIVYVGSNRGAKAWIGKRTRVVDLRGKMVMPGLHDAHVHTLMGGSGLTSCNLNYEPLTTEQFQQRIQACLDRTSAKEPDGWLEVGNWYRQAMKPAGTDATRATLDALRTSRPVTVRSSDGHSSLANSKALELAGITAQTPDPAGGRIDRDAAGEPTGILEDAAGGLVRDLVPPPDADDNVAALRATLDAFRREGVTAFMDQGSSDAVASAYATLRRRGELTARVALAPGVSRALAARSARAAVAPVLAMRKRWETGPIGVRPGLRVRNVGEVGQDGVLQAPAQTASFLTPYFVNVGSDEAPKWVPGRDRGPDPYWPLQDLADVTALLMRHGITPEVHAIGDRAVRHTLDAFQIARKRSGSRLPLSISHAESVDPRDVPRFKRLDVLPAMAFQWAKPSFDSIDAAKNELGPKRFARTEPIGTLWNAGAQVAVGSDWPVDTLDEWLLLQVGITRENPEGGRYRGRLGSSPLLPRRAAIEAITRNAARVMHMDRQTGSLERGKLADLIVLDRNVMRVPAKQIRRTKVLLTMVGGKVVYDAKRDR